MLIEKWILLWHRSCASTLSYLLDLQNEWHLAREAESRMRELERQLAQLDVNMRYVE